MAGTKGGSLCEERRRSPSPERWRGARRRAHTHGRRAGPDGERPLPPSARLDWGVRRWAARGGRVPRCLCGPARLSRARSLPPPGSLWPAVFLFRRSNPPWNMNTYAHRGTQAPHRHRQPLATPQATAHRHAGHSTQTRMRAHRWCNRDMTPSGRRVLE